VVEVAGVAPAPKFQLQFMPPVLPVLVKSTGKPVHCGAVETKLTTGVELMVILCVVVFVQFWSEMVNVTVLVPDEV